MEISMASLAFISMLVTNLTNRADHYPASSSPQKWLNLAVFCAGRTHLLRTREPSTQEMSGPTSTSTTLLWVTSL